MPIARPLLTSLTVLGALALAGCGKSEEAAQEKTDPAIARALAAPMMVDPDLVSRDNSGLAIAGGGPGEVDIPPFEHGPEVIEAARADAAKLVGGVIATAPAPSAGSDPVLSGAVTAVQRAAAIKGPGNACGAKADYALAWSLRLPAALAIYPRGHLLEAAGSDRDGCRLRVVRFVTPVVPDDVVNFYYSRLHAERYTVRHVAADGVHVLSGSSGSTVFALQARKRDDGMTETDIVVNGG